MAEALSPRTDALDVIVELLGALDGSSQSGRDFYDRLCEACCRLGAMERALLLLYDDARQLVVVVGGHGVDAALLSGAVRHARGDARSRRWRCPRTASSR